MGNSSKVEVVGLNEESHRSAVSAGSKAKAGVACYVHWERREGQKKLGNIPSSLELDPSPNISV